MRVLTCGAGGLGGVSVGSSADDPLSWCEDFRLHSQVSRGPCRDTARQSHSIRGLAVMERSAVVRPFPENEGRTRSTITSSFLSL